MIQSEQGRVNRLIRVFLGDMTSSAADQQNSSAIVQQQNQAGFLKIFLETPKKFADFFDE
jgi:hypothetical protein